MIEAIIIDLQNRLEFHDWAALAAVFSMLGTPFLIVAWQNAMEALKNYINKKLAPHGLRLRQRV